MDFQVLSDTNVQCCLSLLRAFPLYSLVLFSVSVFVTISIRFRLQFWILFQYILLLQFEVAFAGFFCFSAKAMSARQ